MSTPLIYTPQGNMAPEHLEEHRAWYRSRHAPTLMGVGFLSARMLDGKGTRWCNLYEIPGIEIFARPEYRQIGQADPFRNKNISRFSNLNVTIYSQERILDGRGVPVDRAPTMGGPLISFVRFDWSATDEALLEWLRDALWRTCADAAPVRTVRLLDRQSGHPEFKSSYPRRCAVVEWSERIVPSAAALETAIAELGSRASQLSHETFSKRFGLLREDCFEA